MVKKLPALLIPFLGKTKNLSLLSTILYVKNGCRRKYKTSDPAIRFVKFSCAYIAVDWLVRQQVFTHMIHVINDNCRQQVFHILYMLLINLVDSIFFTYDTCSRLAWSPQVLITMKHVLDWLGRQQFFFKYMIYVLISLVDSRFFYIWYMLQISLVDSSFFPHIIHVLISLVDSRVF